MSTAEKGRWKIFFGSHIFVLIIAIVAIMVIFAYARVYYQDYMVRQEIQYLEEQTGRLQARKVELLDVLKYVKSDSFAEEKARTELNMVRPGEQVLVVPQVAANSGRQEDGSVVKSDNVSNYKKWFKYFFN